MNLSFRAKLLLALVGSVGVLLGSTFLVIRGQTEAQVRLQVERSLARSREAFAEQERYRQQLLAGFGARFAANNRLPAALDGALMDGSTDYLLQTIQYDLELADIDTTALAAITDADGGPVAALLAGRVLDEPAAAVPADLVARVVETGEPAFGHHLVGDALFSIHVVPLDLFGFPIGTLTLGFPLDNAVAQQLGELLGAEICFAARGRCVASTRGARSDSTLHAAMIEAAGERGSMRMSRRGAPVQLVTDTLMAGGGEAVWRVIGVPLGEVLAPFERIGQAERWAGAVALGIALLLGLVLSRGLARPVRELVAATDRVAHGDFDVRVDVRSKDELGSLGVAFNAMTGELALKERYRGLLDKVVSREIADELLKDEPRLGGESREVTTLFADVRGFTPLTQRLDPHDVVALLNAFMQRASDAVEAEGGVVDKYVGDEVMAIFGAPIARGDDAVRAVRAAQRIRAAMREFNRERAAGGEPTLEVGIGISTGSVVAGNMGSANRLNYTVVGESVNLAARLCASAAADEILISDATRAASGEAVAARPLGERPLKGLDRPVPVHAVDPEPVPAGGGVDRGPAAS